MRILAKECLAADIPTIGWVEGVQDYLDADTGRIRSPYLRSKHVIVPGKFDRKYFQTTGQKVHVGEVVRIRPLWEKPANPTRKESRRVLINSNFSYGVLEEHRDEWVAAAVKSCLNSGLQPVISRHPFDKGETFLESTTEESFYDAIDTCAVSIHRFGAGVLESLAMEVPAIYFNPHNEQVDKFSDPMGAYLYARSQRELERMLSKQEYSWHRKRAFAFLSIHTGITKSTPDAGSRMAEILTSIIREKEEPSEDLSTALATYEDLEQRPKLVAQSRKIEALYPRQPVEPRSLQAEARHQSGGTAQTQAKVSSVEAEASQPKKRFYAEAGEWLQLKAPTTFHLLRFAKRSISAFFREYPIIGSMLLLFAIGLSVLSITQISPIAPRTLLTGSLAMAFMLLIGISAAGTISAIRHAQNALMQRISSTESVSRNRTRNLEKALIERITVLKEDTASAEERIRRLRRDLKRNKEEHSTLAAATEQLERKIAEVDRDSRSRIEGLQGDLQAREDAMKSQIYALERQLEQSLLEEISNVNRKMREHNADNESSNSATKVMLDALDKQADTLNARVSEIEGKVAAFKDTKLDVATLERKIDQLWNYVEQTSQTLNLQVQSAQTNSSRETEALEKRTAEDLASKIAPIDGDFTVIKQHIQSLQSEIEMIKHGQESIAKQSQTRQAEITSNRAKLFNLQEQLTSKTKELSEENATIRRALKDTTDTLSTTGTELEGARSNHEMVAKRLSVLARKIQEKDPFERFNRVLGPQHVRNLKNDWAGPLNLKLTEASLSYLAHSIRTLESNSTGRLATSIQDAVLRCLISVAPQTDEIEVLEIGTLFGIGLSMLYRQLYGRYKKVHLTAIDPLAGYYKTNPNDVLIDVPISAENFWHNMRVADVPKSDVTLIKGMSTHKRVITAAAKRMYDIVIIDADHSYAGVKFDFENYAQMVKPGGYLIFDDYGAGDWPDIKKFVDQEVKPLDTLSFVGSSWRTGVFKVNDSDSKGTPIS